MTTMTVEIKQQARILQVLELIAQGKTVKDACEVADLPRSSYYAIMKTGAFDETLAQMKQANIVEVVTQFTEALPDVYARVVKDARNETEGDETGLSARDRDQAARTMLLIYDKVTQGLTPVAKGESATDWLAKHGSEFQPIQIVDSQVVIVQGEASEVIDSEAEVLEEG